jgi:hypothetical protein
VDKLQVSSDGKLALELSNSSMFKDTKLYFKGSDASRAAGSQAISASVGAEYKTSPFVGVLELNVLETATIPASASGVLNYKGFLFGGEFKANVKTAALTDYNFLLGYKTKELTAVAKTEKKFSTVSAGIWQSVAPDMLVGGEAKLPLSGQGKVEVTGGLQYKISKEQTLNAKFASSGKAGVSYAHQVSKLFKLTLASELDTANIASDDHQLGLTLGFTA